MNHEKRILIINVTRIGDTLFATPAIKAIALAYPNATIDILAHPKRATILNGISFIDKIGGITKNTAIYRGWHTYIFGKTYDLAFVYGYDISLVSYALRVAKKVIAFRQENENINNRLYRVVEKPSSFKEDHTVKLLLRLPASMNIPPSNLRLSYAVGINEKKWAQQRLRDNINDLKNAFPLIGIQTTCFSTRSYSNWPIGHFVNLTRKIMDFEPNTHFLLFGGPAPLEKKRVTALSDILGARSTNLSGMGLRETGAIMNELDLYIGVDTGPTHIMGTFDIPIVVLFHRYIPSDITGPLEHPFAYLVDQPQTDHESPLAVKMSETSVDTVFEKVVEAIKDVA